MQALSIIRAASVFMRSRHQRSTLKLDFGVSVRYPDDFYIPDEKEALEYCDIALSVKEIVERFIK